MNDVIQSLVSDEILFAEANIPSYSIFLRYTIFATHMENLSELVTVYPNVKILHFDVDIKNNRLDFKVVFPRSFHSNLDLM